MKTLFCVVLFFGFATAGAEPGKLFESTTNGRTYYHIEFTLTATNSSMVVPTNYQDSMNRPESVSEITAGGMFEVFIRADDFPIAAPHCGGGWIILRMPATLEGSKAAKSKIEEKRALWERLQNIYITKSGSQSVVIELNPYIRVIDPAGPQLELEYCNVFFRHAYGSYVPYVGQIKARGGAATRSSKSVIRGLEP